MTLRTAIIGPGGELEIVGPLDGHDLTGRTTRADVPADWPTLSRWDAPTQGWVANVDGERARLVERMTAERDAALYGGCITPLGRVKTDPASLLAISFFSSAADREQRLGQAFGIMWPMADGPPVAHDAAALIAMGAAVLLGTAAAQHVFDARQAALNAATTLDALWAVVSA